MKDLLNDLKDEVERHRDRMAELAQAPFSLGNCPVYIIVCPERRTASAFVGSLRLRNYSCNKIGTTRLAAAIVAKSNVEWCTYGPELLSLINIATRTP